MIWVLIICSLAVAAIDYGAIKRLFPSDVERQKRLLIPLLLVDALPFIQWAVSNIISRDNPTWLMMMSMWTNWAYMILAIARAPMMISILLNHRGYLRIAGAMVSLAATALFVYSAVVTRTDYEVRHIVIESERLPESFDGYRIAQISDLHIGSMINPEKELSEIVSICNSSDADLVAFTGDLVNIREEELTPTIDTYLSNIKSKDGVYSVIGNHDIGVYIRDSITHTPAKNLSRLKAHQRRLGWNLLDNQTEYIHRGGDSIAITGISFSQELQDSRHSARLPEMDITIAYEGYSKSTFNITLAHIPQLWDNILAEHLADLTLSGHIHAMQMKFPIGKRGLSPSIIKYKRWSGLYEQQNRWLYINDGVGYVMYPMRIGARPEITLIELRKKVQ